jgi:hypothetical protein
MMIDVTLIKSSFLVEVAASTLKLAPSGEPRKKQR